MSSDWRISRSWSTFSNQRRSLSTGPVSSSAWTPHSKRVPSPARRTTRRFWQTKNNVKYRRDRNWFESTRLSNRNFRRKKGKNSITLSTTTMWVNVFEMMLLPTKNFIINSKRSSSNKLMKKESNMKMISSCSNKNKPSKRVLHSRKRLPSPKIRIKRSSTRLMKLKKNLLKLNLKMIQKKDKKLMISYAPVVMVNLNNATNNSAKC